MKAITIWQPWASLLAKGVKQYETRSWATSYRGPIAIHSSVIKVPQVLKKCFPMSEYNDHLDHKAKMKFLDAIATGLNMCCTPKDVVDILNEFPTGSVVATANLVDCHRITTSCGIHYGAPFIMQKNGAYSLEDVEIALGDWTPGRYAWEFSDMKPIKPVPTKGKQGLWEWQE